MFQASDIVGFAVALFLFIPVILAPGFALGWWFDLLNFRSLQAPLRWALATLFGLSLTPILLYLTLRYFSIIGVWGFLTISLITSLIAIKESGGLRLSGIPRATKLAIFIWLLLVLLTTLDFVTHNRLYPSAAIIDQSYRSQVVASLAHNDALPPVSYFYHPGTDVALKYHYFLFLLAAVTERLGGGLVTSHIALSALSAWVGLALMALVAAFIRFFFARTAPPRALQYGLGLLLVGGLDILPVGADILRRAVSKQPEVLPFPDVEWWNGWGQVFSWLDTAIWQPHHLAALISLLTACLLLWHSRDQSGFRRWGSVLASALACASASGMSIYVTAVFAVFLLIVTFEVALNAPRFLLPLVATGILTALLLLPFVRELQTTSAQPAPFNIGISVRPFIPVNPLLDSLHVRSTLGWNLTYVALLPLNYLFEFGVFMIGGIGYWLWSKRTTAPDIRNHFLVGLFLVSIVLSTFVWSGNEMSNDFGYRGILPAQFVLLLASAIFLASPESPRAFASLALASRVALILGFATTLLGIVMVRAVVGGTNAGVWPHFQSLRYGNSAERLLDLRSAYDWLRSNTPASAVVQENPAAWQTLAQGQYSERRTAVYGSLIEDGQNRQYITSLHEVGSLFNSDVSSARVEAVCSEYGIDYLVVQDCDLAWHVRKGFVWTSVPAFATQHVRVIRCK